jgi:PhoH-like ATPase
MSKTYVLDTNVLLHNPQALFAFEDNDVVIPLAVIEEIDNQKKRQDEIGRNARVVSQKLDEMRTLGRLAEGVQLPHGGRLRIELNHQEWTDFPRAMDAGKCDNRILAVAASLCRSSPELVILVTKDLNLRVKADVLGISAEDFYNDKVDFHRLYTGVEELEVTGSDMDRFHQDGMLPVNGRINTLPHQFVIMKHADQRSQSAPARYCGQTLWPLKHAESMNWGIRALNREQQFALELLRDDEIKVVSLVGRSGTGKTLLALAVGLEKVIEESVYSRLLITRPVMPMGNDLGYLPGTKEEKLRPWIQPIYDNLEFLFRDCSEPFEIVEDLTSRGVLEVEALTYIRGRSIPRQFIICDEAQNLSPHMVKTLVTRVGEGTKIVFTGDPEQIDHPYLDASSNGLTYLVERLKGEEIAGHVTLLKGERSKVAEMASRLL